jgi:uncharacterized protein
MPTDHIRYDLLAQDALRGVVRRVLSDIAKNGVPGDHHFYITFGTRLPGVKMSQRLLAQYPEEMRIVLQHQFWDLTVSDEGFEVGLSFGGVPERLTVPFSAVTAFLDPSVQFGLQFTTLAAESETAAEPAKPVPAKSSATGPAVRRSTPGEPAPPAPDAVRKPAAEQKAEASDKASKSDKPDNEPGPPSGGAEVVRFDRFRKK